MFGSKGKNDPSWTLREKNTSQSLNMERPIPESKEKPQLEEITLKQAYNKVAKLLIKVIRFWKSYGNSINIVSLQIDQPMLSVMERDFEMLRRESAVFRKYRITCD
jgi:hypothetical protein